MRGCNQLDATLSNGATGQGLQLGADFVDDNHLHNASNSRSVLR